MNPDQCAECEKQKENELCPECTTAAAEYAVDIAVEELDCLGF